jgi:hypothetical protein
MAATSKVRRFFASPKIVIFTGAGLCGFPYILGTVGGVLSAAVPNTTIQNAISFGLWWVFVAYLFTLLPLGLLLVVIGIIDIFVQKSNARSANNNRQTNLRR